VSPLRTLDGGLVTHTRGERCPTKGHHDIPDFQSRCVICEVWEYYDDWLGTRK
jgi:hypothetical protein